MRKLLLLLVSIIVVGTLFSQDLYQIEAVSIDTAKYQPVFGVIEMDKTTCSISTSNYKGKVVVDVETYIEDKEADGTVYCGWKGLLVDSDGTKNIALYMTRYKEYTVISLYFYDGSIIEFLTRRI